ncbi:MAG: hypothetical protein Kow00127_16140 [Bacteroidales bacterium]
MILSAEYNRYPFFMFVPEMNGWQKYIVRLILPVMLLAGMNSLKAQQVRAGAILGMNLSQVDGDEIYGFTKPGINLGLTAVVPIGNNLFFSLETLFNQKGSRQGPQYKAVDSLGVETTGEYNLTLNYVEVPALVFYNDKNILSAGGGLSYGRLVGVSEYEHGNKVESTTVSSGPYSRDDLNILADVRFRVYKKLRMNVRYAYSLKKIRTRTFYSSSGNSWERDQYNNQFSVRLIWMFNDKTAPVASPVNDDAGF